MPHSSFLAELLRFLPAGTTVNTPGPEHVQIQLPQGADPRAAARKLSGASEEWHLCHTETEAEAGNWVRCRFFRSVSGAAGVDILCADILRAGVADCSGPSRRSRGVMIAFQGTDGSGKSTIINGLYKALGDFFPEQQMAYYHCRPFLFQPSKASHGLNMDAVCPDPHSSKPYGKLVSLGKLAYCTVDYILGYRLRIRKELKEGKLVIFDRYYYDFYLDKLRYRMSLSDFWFRLFEPFIPKPDITFVLTGQAEPIWQRKQEISLEEVREQIRLLELHRAHFAHPETIDVVRSIPEVVGTVTSAVLRLLSSRL